jgi:hypothetical protein
LKTWERWALFFGVFLVTYVYGLDGTGEPHITWLLYIFLHLSCRTDPPGLIISYRYVDSEVHLPRLRNSLLRPTFAIINDHRSQERNRSRSAGKSHLGRPDDRVELSLTGTDDDYHTVRSTG